MTERFVTPAVLDNWVATHLTQVGSATRAAVMAIIGDPSAASPGLGLLVVTPNPDGSWIGRTSLTRQEGVKYWWVMTPNSVFPTVDVGYVAGDFVAPAPFAQRS